MTRKSKYNTKEEKLNANRVAAKKWYHAHKNDEEFKQKRNAYHRKYYNNIKETKREYLRSYNTDYAFYIKNVRTGKFERKIIKTKEELKELESKLHSMENRMSSLLDRFGHLDKKEVQNVD